MLANRTKPGKAPSTGFPMSTKLVTLSQKKAPAYVFFMKKKG